VQIRVAEGPFGEMGAGQVGLTEICAEQVGIFQTPLCKSVLHKSEDAVDVRLREFVRKGFIS
jgi:hypothetical protein